MSVMIVKEEGAVLGVNVGYPIVTSGIFCMRGGDVALPKLLCDFLFAFFTGDTSTMSMFWLSIKY